MRQTTLSAVNVGAVQTVQVSNCKEWQCDCTIIKLSNNAHVREIHIPHDDKHKPVFVDHKGYVWRDEL